MKIFKLIYPLNAFCIIYATRSGKILILNKEGIIEKFPMSVAPMSR